MFCQAPDDTNRCSQALWSNPVSTKTFGYHSAFPDGALGAKLAPAKYNGTR